MSSVSRFPLERARPPLRHTPLAYAAADPAAVQAREQHAALWANAAEGQRLPALSTPPVGRDFAAEQRRRRQLARMARKASRRRSGLITGFLVLAVLGIIGLLALSFPVSG